MNQKKEELYPQLVALGRFNIGGEHRKDLDWNVYCDHDAENPSLCLTVEFGHGADLNIWFREASRMKDFLDSVQCACNDKPVDLNGHCSGVLVLSDDDDNDVFTLTMHPSDMERLYHNLLDGYRVAFEGESPRLIESKRTS